MFAFDLVYSADDWNNPERAARRAALNPSWTDPDPKYKTFPFPADSRMSMVVNIVCENKKVKHVSWNPVMINEHTQPRCLRQSEPEFNQVVEYMRRITKGQKMSTQYKVSDDEVLIS